MRAYDLRTADRRYRRSSRDYSPRSAAIGRFRQKKNRAGFTLPGKSNSSTQEKLRLTSYPICSAYLFPGGLASRRSYPS